MLRQPEEAHLKKSIASTGSVTPSLISIPSRPPSFQDARAISGTTINVIRCPSPSFSNQTWSFRSGSSDTTGSTPCLMINEKEVSATTASLRSNSEATLSVPYLSVENFEKRQDLSFCEVETLHRHDDFDQIPRWKRHVYRIAPFCTLLAAGSYFLYFAYRIHCTISAQEAYQKKYVLAWLFIVSEALVIVPTILHSMYSLFAIRGRRRPQLRIKGDLAPTVDVFVTCCKEDIDIILDTTRAACAVDYPLGRFRVVVCDDGADMHLEQAVEILAKQYPNLYYHSRKKIPGVPHHFKAGNLIDATRMVSELPGGPGEFIAALDADMIPEPAWLRAIVAHMVIDPKLALTCPPQLFYNVPDGDPLAQRLDGFFHVMEPVKDANGVAWCTGSGYGIRRAALDSINGWPTGSLAEDVCTSSMLLGAGWKTAFIHEPLQFGTVPDTYTGHLKQRTRWTLGTLQTSWKLRFCLFGKLASQMSFSARLSGFVFAVDAFFKIFLLIALLTIPIVLLTGGTMVAYANHNQLQWQIRFCLAFWLLNRLNQWIANTPAGYRLTQNDAASQIWMAPYHAITVIQSFILPKWLGGKAMAFKPSGSVKSELNERDPKMRAPLWHRLRFTLINCKVFIHVIYISLIIAAVVYSTVRAFDYHSTRPILIYLVTHAFWPPVLWIFSLTAALQPLVYAIWPPTMPDREELLDRDPKTQVAHPKEQWKQQRWQRKGYWQEAQYSLVTVYTVLVFAGSFYV